MSKFIRTTIAEPFPVFGHNSKRADEGPFYAAGSEWFELYSERTLAWKCRSAERLRGYGYTVTVDIVSR